MSNSQRRGLGAILGIAIVLIIGLSTVPDKSRRADSASPDPAVDSWDGAPNRGSASSLMFRPASANTVFDVLVELRGQLEKGTPETNRKLLAEFFQAQSGTQASAELVKELIRFLDSGTDCVTGLKFRVGAGHTIQDWPTLRVAVLDWLGSLSPTEAARYAETIFSGTNSGDEYAVALRNLALGKTDDNSALTKHFVALLENDHWQASPSAGYLEAYDVAVYLADPSLVVPLADQFMASTNERVRRASFISLDRLAQANPSEILPEAVKNRSLANVPRTRAGLLARADIRQPAQLALVESYLLNPAVSAEEADFFVQAFPNGSGFMAHGLLSDNPSVDFADLAQQDQTALTQIQKWQLDGRFEQRWPALKQLEVRLVKYVASAVRGGLLAPTSAQ